MTSSVAAQAVTAKHEDIVTKYNNSIDKVEELHHVAVSEVLPSVLQEMNLEDDQQAEARAMAFLDDRGGSELVGRPCRLLADFVFSLCSFCSYAVPLLSTRKIH